MPAAPRSASTICRQRLQTLAQDIELDPPLVASLLAPAARRATYSRACCRNLRAIYVGKGEPLKALAASNRIVALVPDAAEEYRDRAELYAELECFRAALDDYRHYLRLKPAGPRQRSRGTAHRQSSSRSPRA